MGNEAEKIKILNAILDKFENLTEEEEKEIVNDPKYDKGVFDVLEKEFGTQSK